MFFNNNDYSIPVVLGYHRSFIRTAMKLLKLKRIRPHVFSDGFSLLHRLIFKCHRILPFDEEWISSSLVSFASELEEYYTPILLLTDDCSRAVAHNLTETLGARYIIVDAEEYYKGESLDDNG